MKKIASTIIFCTLLLFAGTSHCPAGQEEGAGIAASVLEVINQLRSDPITGYSALGLDLDCDRSECQSALSGLEDGVPTLALDQGLSDLARERAEAQDKNNAAPVACRDDDSGGDQKGVRCFSLGGSIYFENYIAPDKALVKLLMQLLEDEAGRNSEGKTRILDGSLRDAGVYFGEVSREIDGRVLNGYALRIELSSNREFMLEGSLGSMLNDFRTGSGRFAPKAAVEAKGIDPSLKDVSGKMPPMAWSNALYQVADAAAVDLNAGWDSWEDSDRLYSMISDMTEQKGYDAQGVDFVAAYIDTESSSSFEEIAREIFDMLAVESGLDMASFGRKRGTEVAFRVLPSTLDGDAQGVIVAGVAAVPLENRFHVMGRLTPKESQGLDPDGMDPYQGVRVGVHGSHMPQPVFSGADPLGRFQVRLPFMNFPFALADIRVHDENGRFSGQEKRYVHNTSIWLTF